MKGNDYVKEVSTSVMSSGASVNALQRLVKLLKLEAGMERIKVL